MGALIVQPACADLPGFQIRGATVRSTAGRVITIRSPAPAGAARLVGRADGGAAAVCSLPQQCPWRAAHRQRVGAGRAPLFIPNQL